MSTAMRVPRPAGPGSSAAAKVFSIADIQAEAKTSARRYGLHAKPGWGKTSFGAQTPKPIFIQTRGETGLDTLIQSGQLHPTPHFPEINTWGELTAAIRFLRTEEHEFKTLVIDTLPGAERLCYEYVCERDFDNDWGERGFTGYMRGYEVAMAEWRLFLNMLDDMRSERGLTVFALFHSKIKTFRNPLGADYDRWAPDMQDKCWGLTMKWLDCVLFGTFETVVSTGNRSDANNPNKKGKAVGAARMLYTEEQPGYDAKNRLGLPEEIEMGSSPEEAWANFSAALKNGRKVAVHG